jgi:hypothetical protein
MEGEWLGAAILDSSRADSSRLRVGTSAPALLSQSDRFLWAKSALGGTPLSELARFSEMQHRCVFLESGFDGAFLDIYLPVERPQGPGPFDSQEVSADITKSLVFGRFPATGQLQLQPNAASK